MYPMMLKLYLVELLEEHSTSLHWFQHKLRWLIYQKLQSHVIFMFVFMIKDSLLINAKVKFLCFLFLNLLKLKLICFDKLTIILVLLNFIKIQVTFLLNYVIFYEKFKFVHLNNYFYVLILLVQFLLKQFFIKLLF